MEISFYKNREFNTGFLIWDSLCTIIVIPVLWIAGISETYVFGLVWIVLNLGLMTSYRFFFTKVYIDKDRIVWKIFKKEINHLSWDMITSVQKMYINRTQSIIFNYVDGNSDQELYFNVSRNLVKKIIAICPDEKVIKMLSEIKYRRFP